MAVVVKNTFLDIAGHKFLFDEPCCIERRCHSTPPSWKPVMPHTRSMPNIRTKKRTLSIASSSSTQSDLASYFSGESLEVESLEAPSPSPESRMGNRSPCFYGVPAPYSDSVKDVSNDTNETSDSTNACVACVRTRLKVAAPAFQPMPADTRLDAITNAVYLALVSCGQACHMKIEKGVPGTSPTLLSVELQSGPRSCYDAIHLARQALEAITTRLDAVALLSKRVQKEDRGYSLRSSVACLPQGAQDHMCWDLFHKGCCPRRSKCQWYHPAESHIEKFKVSTRCSEEVIGVSKEDQLAASFPAERHKISLGELVQ